jgi:hypothetical protein
MAQRPSKSKKGAIESQNRLCVYGVTFATWLFGIYIVFFSPLLSTHYTRADQDAIPRTHEDVVPVGATLDRDVYDAKLKLVANYSASTSSTTVRLWPAKAPYPKAGALLPANRIIAYYGNFYSTKMGVLGEYPPAQMLSMLAAEKKKWEAADPSTPVIPAIDYIAITAQGSPGADGKYRFRMPGAQIDQAVTLANQAHGIVILDIQVGLSNLQTELPLLEKYLKMPQVHLAIDPEFAMHNGAKPGSVVGSFDAVDINYAANYLKSLVVANNLPPKILIVHRFTQKMVTNTSLIKPLPEVQIVMDMDGWGSPAKKLNTYQQFVATQPVQFTGFKLFYKNDLKPPSTRLLTPAELLKLTPRPLFIQYQ